VTSSLEIYIDRISVGDWHLLNFIKSNDLTDLVCLSE
jgi:hypothetical protein